MTEFLNQMDYVFFVYGLAFILLAAACADLHKKESKVIPWFYFSLFGLAHGLNEWIDMLAISLGSHTWLKWVQLIVMGCSFIFLIEFGRTNSSSRLLGKWIYVFLLSGAAAFGVYGILGLNVGTRLFLGFTGASLSAWYLLKLSKNKNSSKILYILGFFTAAYAISTGLIGPNAPFFPALIINQETFLKWAGFPVQLLRAAIACAMALLVWQYRLIDTYDLKDKTSKAKVKISMSVGIISLILLIMFGWFLVNRTRDRVIAKQKNNLFQIIQQIGLAVDPQHVKKLTASSSDLQNPSYQYLKNQLQALRKIDPDIRFVYLMRKTGGKVVLLVDSESPGSEDESPPGQVFEEASLELINAFTSGQTIVEGPTADRWGVWISGMVPLKDTRTQEIIALLGIDKNAKDIMAIAYAERIKVIILLILIYIISIFMVMYFQRFSEAMDYAKEKTGLFIRYGVPGLILFVGFTLTILIYLNEKEREEQKFQTVFLQRAVGRVELISKALATQLDRLEGVRRFFDNSTLVDREEFNNFVSPITDDVPLQAIEWIPRVKREERESYETKARQEGLMDFLIREKDAKGKLVSSIEKDEYFPVYFLQPVQSNESAIGYDVSSNPARWEAMEKSRDLAQPIVTAPVSLVQASGDSSGFMVFVPVYLNGNFPDSREDRRKELKGFILGVYRGEEFLNGIYSRMPQEGLMCLIEDPYAPQEARVIYRSKPQIGSVDWDKIEIKYEVPMLVAGREWLVSVVPGTYFMEANYSYGYRWIIPVGIFLTGLLAFFMNNLVMGRYRSEWMVRLKTKELLKEKLSLLKSEERFSQLAEISGEFIWEIDPNGLYTFASPMVEFIYGYKPEEIVGKKYFYDFFPIDEKEKLLPEIFAGINKREVFKNYNNPIINRDGNKALLLTNAMPILDKDNNLNGYRGVDRDITAAKNAEDALRKREAYLTSILDNFPYLVWLKDFDGRFLAVNNCFAEACGFPINEIIGKTDLDIWPREMAERYIADDVKVIFGKMKTVVEEPIVNGDTVSYFETYKSPILDNEGRVIGTTGFAHDISERKKAEQALRSSEERYRQIAAVITDYIYTVFIENGKQSRVNYNATCMAVTGYSVEEFHSDDSLWIKMVVEDDRPMVLRQIDAILSGKRDVDPIEHRINHKDGRIRWIRNTVVPHYDGFNNLISYDGLITDNTDKKYAEERIKKAYEQTKTILEKMPFGVIIIGTDKKIRQVNKAALNLMGVKSEDEIAGQFCYACMCPSKIDSCPILDLKNSVDTAETVLICKDGKEIPILKSVLPINIEGEEVLLEAFVDISQRKKAEEQLKAAKETAEKALAIKDDFTSTVSHELRTPLAAIKSSVDILDTELPGKLTEDQKTFIKRVKTNIDRLARLINDVLDLSKLESGKMKFNLVHFHPEVLFQEVVDTQASVAKNKGLNISLKFEENLPIMYADKDKLTQVMNNLLNNAIKFTKEGDITIEISPDYTKQQTRFCVRDKGMGIKEEDIPTLFQKFQQVGGAHSVSGTGLGLAICKEIVEHHGGKIWAESEFGNGSAFFFTVPLKKDKRVLVVDDDRGTVELIKGILNKTGKFEVEAAYDGFEAGQKCLKFNPNIIILDVGLPKLGGLDICSRLKTGPKTKNIKIMLISSFTEELENKAWEAGADEILCKPVNPEELLTKIEKVA